MGPRPDRRVRVGTLALALFGVEAQIPGLEAEWGPISLHHSFADYEARARACYAAYGGTDHLRMLATAAVATRGWNVYGTVDVLPVLDYPIPFPLPFPFILPDPFRP